MAAASVVTVPGVEQGMHAARKEQRLTLQNVRMSTIFEQIDGTHVLHQLKISRSSTKVRTAGPSAMVDPGLVAGVGLAISVVGMALAGMGQSVER